MKYSKFTLGVFLIMLITIFNTTLIWGDNTNPTSEDYKKLEQKVSELEKQLDKTNTEEIIKLYKESENGIYRASDKALSIANYLVLVIGAMAVIKGIKDAQEMNSYRKTMEDYKQEIKKHEEEIKKYKDEIADYIEYMFEDKLPDIIRDFTDSIEEDVDEIIIEMAKLEKSINNLNDISEEAAVD